jgi:hypothetical protein
MSVRLLAVLGIALSCSAVESNAEPKKADKSSLYFPIIKGTRRVYEVKAGGNTSEFIDVVTRVDEKDGRYKVSVGREVGGKVMPLLTAEVSTDGLSWLSAGNRDYNSPSRQLKLPIKAGETWEWQAEDPADKAIKMSYRTIGEEEIEVPAGKFRAVRVEATAELDGKSVKSTDWYAPAVGCVKTIAKIGERETVITLREFAPGKD